MSDRHHFMLPTKPWSSIDDVIYDATHSQILRCPDQHVARAIVSAVNDAVWMEKTVSDIDDLHDDLVSENSARWEAEREAEDLRARVAELEKKLADAAA